MAKFDLTGKKFGLYNVIGKDFDRSGKNSYWFCECECGNVKSVATPNLKRGMVSCGCNKKKMQSIKATTHGMSNTSEYRSWQHMLGRCFNVNDNAYDDYGGRGITVCDEWRWSFENFLSDMGKKPSPNHSIDRIDNDGDYTPLNCRWATWTQQANNKRRGKLTKTNTSGFIGVSWSRKSNKWTAGITYKGKSIYLGSFNDIEDAVKARKEAEIKYWN